MQLLGRPHLGQALLLGLHVAGATAAASEHAGVLEVSGQLVLAAVGALQHRLLRMLVGVVGHHQLGVGLLGMHGQLVLQVVGGLPRDLPVVVVLAVAQLHAQAKSSAEALQPCTMCNACKSCTPDSISKQHFGRVATLQLCPRTCFRAGSWEHRPRLAAAAQPVGHELKFADLKQPLQNPSSRGCTLQWLYSPSAMSLFL